MMRSKNVLVKMYSSSKARRLVGNIALALLASSFLFAFQSRAFAQSDTESPDAVAIFNHGQDLHEKGDLKGAIELYQRALKAIPEVCRCSVDTATMYLLRGLVNHGCVRCSQWAKRDPDRGGTPRPAHNPRPAPLARRRC